MVKRDGEYCFSMVSFSLEFCAFQGSVSDQLFGCWLPYDVEKVVILKNVLFFVVEYYKDYIEYCKR